MRNWHRIGQKGSSMRRCAFLAMGTVAASLLAVGCSATSTGHPPAPAVSLPPDPHTASALLKIATAFNRDYDSGNYRPVYARWDARSQAIITRADYLRRPRASAGARMGRGWCITESAGSSDRLLVLRPPPVGVRPGAQQPRRGQAVPDVPEPVCQGRRLRTLTARVRRVTAG